MQSLAAAAGHRGPLAWARVVSPETNKGRQRPGRERPPGAATGDPRRADSLPPPGLPDGGQHWACRCTGSCRSTHPTPEEPKTSAAPQTGPGTSKPRPAGWAPTPRALAQHSWGLLRGAGAGHSLDGREADSTSRSPGCPVQASLGPSAQANNVRPQHLELTSPGAAHPSRTLSQPWAAPGSSGVHTPHPHGVTALPWGALGPASPAPTMPTSHSAAQHLRTDGNYPTAKCYFKFPLMV